MLTLPFGPYSPLLPIVKVTTCAVSERGTPAKAVEFGETKPHESMY